MARGLQELIFPVALAFFIYIYSYQIENPDVTYTHVLKILKFLKERSPPPEWLKAGFIINRRAISN